MDLPITREEWITAYPGRNPRYLAYCNAVRADPANMDTPAFMGWINKHRSNFLHDNCIHGDTIPESLSEAFTAYLWGELLF